jgi:hypothetical protein
MYTQPSKPASRMGPEDALARRPNTARRMGGLPTCHHRLRVRGSAPRLATQNDGPPLDLPRFRLEFASDEDPFARIQIAAQLHQKTGERPEDSPLDRKASDRIRDHIHGKRNASELAMSIHITVPSGKGPPCS